MPLASGIMSLHPRKPLWWLLSQDNILDDASLSEDTPNRGGLASSSVDVLDHHILAQPHSSLPMLLHILSQHQKSMKVACPDFLSAFADSSVSLYFLCALANCTSYTKATGLLYQRSTPKATFIWFLSYPPFLPLLPTYVHKESI